MSTFAIESVGFCAHYSRQGDWAFAFALSLARPLGLRLNVFHFVEDPYRPPEAPPRSPAGVSAAALVERERELRMYYDALLGDYVNAGFRLCAERSWKELHRCLARREFQVLVLASPREGATFAGMPLESFAEAFVSPVAIVGPDRSDAVFLNRPAALVADRLGLGSGAFRVASSPPPPRRADGCAGGVAAIR